MSPRPRDADVAAAAAAAERAGRRERGPSGGCFGRLPGWHAWEVAQAIRHFEGTKEAVRDLRSEVSARLPEPQVIDHALRCLIGAFLGGCEEGEEIHLAHRIRSIETAAHLAALQHLPPVPAPQRDLRVLGGSQGASPREGHG